MTPLLEVKKLHAAYGRVPILSGAEFSMEAGEFLGILGHNGMGKTTLMKTLMGHLPVSSGSITFAGEDITRFAPHRRARAGLGLVPQGREIFASLTVYENLRMGLASAEKEDPSVIARVLQDFPRLERLLDRRGGALSGGEQQLLALARCLCTRPKLILLDEPTEGIQPSIIDEIIDTLASLKTRWGLSMIIVEQNLEFITSLSDRVLRIQKGRIVGTISAEELRSEQAHFGAPVAPAP